MRGQWLGGGRDGKTRVNNYAHIGHLYGLDWTGLDGWMKQIPQQLFIYLLDENNILKMIKDSHANSNPPTNKR
jgi:hypothetical protein